MTSEFLGKDWFSTRGYLHFDSRISANSRAQIEAYVSNPVSVAKHPFLPFLRFEKEKPKIEYIEGKGRRYVPGIRLICYAAHTDAQIYAYYSTILAKEYEKRLSAEGLSANVIAFRELISESGKAKCNIHLADDAFRAIAELGPCTAYAFDVKKFFDSLDRRTLKTQWCSLIGCSELPTDHYAVFKSVTRYKYINRDAAFDLFGIPKNRGASRNYRVICTREELNRAAQNKGFVNIESRGIPQGSPISAILANIYMFPFDLVISKAMSARGGSYFRYCDDILCILPTGQEMDIERFIQDELAKLHLSLNKKKTDIATFARNQGGGLRSEKPIQYLGFHFDGRRERVSIRPGSVHRYRKKLVKSVNLAIATARKHNEARKLAGRPPTPIYLKKIFRRYSHVGRRNFISYSRRALQITGSVTIQRQLANFDRFFQQQIARASAARIHEG